jgi:hypothetical protein
VSEILLDNGVIVYLLSEVLLYIPLFVAFVVTIHILKRWDFDKFTQEQFALESRAYLVMTIVFFVILLKVLLLPYFIYTIDGLSDIVPGAMCGAGIITANGYGDVLLDLKIVILFISGFWVTLNRLDLSAKEYPYMQIKSWLFITLFILLSVEIGLDILYFTHIETTKPVTCCSVIFGSTRSVLPFGLDIDKLLILFYLLYALIILTTISQVVIGLLLSSLLFFPIAYYSVVYFFGTYIYELPTHKCPFCMMQEPYYYIGYIIWGSLLIGAFLSIDYAIVKLLFDKSSSIDKTKWYGVLSITLFVLICSGYLSIYYFKNGVFL